jgi:hypothetical protein
LVEERGGDRGEGGGRTLSHSSEVRASRSAKAPNLVQPYHRLKRISIDLGEAKYDDMGLSKGMERKHVSVKPMNE